MRVVFLKWFCLELLDLLEAIEKLPSLVIDRHDARGEGSARRPFLLATIVGSLIMSHTPISDTNQQPSRAK